MNEKEKEIKEEIAKKMKSRLISKKNLADHFGLSKSAVSLWFTRTIPRTRIKDICSLLNMDYNSLIGLNSSNQPIKAYDIKPIHDHTDLDSDDVMINVYDIELSAGNGSVIPEFVDTKKQLSFSLDWIQKKGFIPRDLKLMKVSGDSMIPVINDEDMVLINTSKKDIIDGKIYALIIGGEAKIKRLKRSFDGGLVVISDNTAHIYNDEKISPKETRHIIIMGMAVHRSGDI